MLFLVSFYFLDLRFVITRTFDEDTRYDWLKPQWLWAKRGVTQVGRLGQGNPIPGRDRILPAYNQHATVGGGLLLQTQSEFDKKRTCTGVKQDGFAIQNRELVADEWGQVRFDLLFETPASPSTIQAKLEALFDLRLIAPLVNDGEEVTLLSAPALIAGVYESESLKTSKGYREPRIGKDCTTKATSGTVSSASEAPQVVLIDLERELGTEVGPPIQCSEPCEAELRLFGASVNGAELLVWHLTPTISGPTNPRLADAAWSAAFGLSWLIGQIHELAVFKSRVNDYQRTGQSILPDLVRTSIKNRNNRFGRQMFGGWDTKEVVSVAVHSLWIARGEADEHLKELQSFVRDERDAGGITGNLRRIVIQAKSLTVNNNINEIVNEGNMTNPTQNTGSTVLSGTFTGSNVNVASTLTNVSQNIGSLPNADQATRDELQKLIASLHDELQKLPVDKKELVDAVTSTTGDVIDKAKQGTPNRTLLKIAIDGMKRAAETLKDVAPPVVSIATTIAGVIAKLHGL